ncbi:MAG: hypothetical protein ACK5YN_06670 [Gemmatimonas sp.]
MDRDGHLVLVALDMGGTFIGSTSVARVDGGWGDDHPTRAEYVMEFDGPRNFLPRAPREAPTVAEHLTLLRRGVRRAPWLHLGGRPEWLAIDHAGRLVCSAILPWRVLRERGSRRAEEQAIKAELQRMLDTFDPLPSAPKPTS